MEDPDVHSHGTSWTAVRPENVGPPGEVAVDVTRSEAAAELVSKLLGEPEVEGELIGAEVPDGRAVDVGERDVAEGEVPQGHADGLALVELPRSAEVGQRHVVDQSAQPWRIPEVGLEGLVREGHSCWVPRHGCTVRRQGHAGVSERTAPGIRRNGQERDGGGDGVQLELLCRFDLRQLCMGRGGKDADGGKNAEGTKEENPGSHKRG